MRCEDVRPILDDYVDGGLTEGQSVAIEAHVSGCAACRRVLDAQRALLKQTKGLPSEILPGRDLWSGIEPALVRPSRKFIWRGSLSAAAILVVAFGMLLAHPWLGTIHLEPGTRSEGIGGESDEIRKAETEYARAHEELLASFAQHSDALAPETRRVIQHNLDIIDAAVAEIRASLRKDPENAHLMHMLAGVQAQELDLIRLAVRLSTDT